MKKPRSGHLGCGFHFGLWKKLLEPKTQRHRQSGAPLLARLKESGSSDGTMGSRNWEHRKLRNE